MNWKSILITVFYSLVFLSNLSSQYLGGTQDGFATGSFSSSLNIYSGGYEDGFAVYTLKNSLSIYNGNDKDGYAIDEAQSELDIFFGGTRDGYNIGNYLNSYSIHYGGNGDGYNQGNFVLDFIWTGNVNQNWDEEDNWNTNLVPDITRRVVIPRVFTQFPVLTGGTLSIGKDPFGGNFFCRSIILEENAMITLRSGTQLFNFDSINIFGTMIVNNTSIDAVRNLNDGIIIIRNGGSFLIE